MFHSHALISLATYLNSAWVLQPPAASKKVHCLIIWCHCIQRRTGVPFFYGNYHRSVWACWLWQANTVLVSLCVRLSRRRSSASLPQTNIFSDSPLNHTYLQVCLLSLFKGVCVGFQPIKGVCPPQRLHGWRCSKSHKFILRWRTGKGMSVTHLWTHTKGNIFVESSETLLTVAHFQTPSDRKVWLLPWQTPSFSNQPEPPYTHTHPNKWELKVQRCQLQPNRLVGFKILCNSCDKNDNPVICVLHGVVCKKSCCLCSGESFWWIYWPVT